ncbi:MAG: hypothetical protein ABIG43_02605 [Chloroflexota bacterium]
MECVEYAGWKNCYRLANKQIELIITADVGPRVIRFGFIGAENEFKQFTEQLGRTGGDIWLIYGGHRLWHAPEDMTRTYFPDNQRVKVKEIMNGLRVIQDTEPTTGLQKVIELRIDTDLAKVSINHKLINHNLWPVNTAVWAISVMAPGGTAVMPLPARGPHPENFLPTSRLSIWPYTDFSDSRWVFGEKYILLKQDINKPAPQKLGLLAPDGWLAYARDGHLFIKKMIYQENANYPDLGCNLEIYTDKEILELETLGPLQNIEPGETIEHHEEWNLFKDVPVPQNDDDVKKDILPHIT